MSFANLGVSPVSHFLKKYKHEEIHRKGMPSIFGGESSVGQRIEGVVLQSTGGHLKSIKAILTK
jgi:hypothetical protein